MNPSAPIGPWDVKPTPTGQMVVDFLRGKMVALARHRAERGARQGRGARAYPGGRARPRRPSAISSATRTSLCSRSSPSSRGSPGIRAPRFRVPYALAWATAAAMESVAALTRRPPQVPLTAVRMARKRMFFSAAKAVDELGLPQTPARDGARRCRRLVRRARATRPAPRGRRERGPVRLAAHPQEPLELLLRLPLPAPWAARRALRRVRLLPHRRRCRGRRPGPRRAAARARPLARGDRAASTGAPPRIPPGSGSRRRSGAFPIPREVLDEIITGVEMDLDHPRYETFEDLYPYCYRVASAVGLACIEIFGYRDPRARDYAVHLGIALQLTNIMRDVQADARAGRVYLPQEDLRRFGVTAEDLAAGRYTPALRRADGLARRRAPATTTSGPGPRCPRGRGGALSPRRSWGAPTGRSCAPSKPAASASSAGGSRCPRTGSSRSRSLAGCAPAGVAAVRTRVPGVPDR